MKTIQQSLTLHFDLVGVGGRRRHSVASDALVDSGVLAVDFREVEHVAVHLVALPQTRVDGPVDVALPVNLWLGNASGGASKSEVVGLGHDDRLRLVDFNHWREGSVRNDGAHGTSSPTWNRGRDVVERCVGPVAVGLLAGVHARARLAVLAVMSGCARVAPRSGNAFVCGVQK
jgi:hypothetical protein